MLSYLPNCVCPEIQMAVHQTAQFYINPMQSHKLAIMRIGQYLVVSPERGIIYTRLTNPKHSKSMLMHMVGVLQTWKMQTMFFHGLVLLFVMLTVPLFGAASFRQNCPFYSRGRVYCHVSCSLWDNTNSESHEEDSLYLQYAQSHDRFLYHSSWGQSISHCYGRIVKVHTSH